MMRTRLSRGIRGWMALALLSAACTSGGAPLAVPADLPNRTEQSGITFRWALARDPATVRAVGVMEPGSRPVPWATVALFGVDAGGRVVSRGQTDLRGGFGRASLPFEGPQREDWHFVPRSRPGVMLREMDEDAQAWARRLLHAGLSHSGADTAQAILQVRGRVLT